MGREGGTPMAVSNCWGELGEDCILRGVGRYAFCSDLGNGDDNLLNRMKLGV